MSDGFDEMTPELKAELKEHIMWCSDTGTSKVFLKDSVQEQFPSLDKRAIYRTIKEMIRDWDLFVSDDGLIKCYEFYPNIAVQMLEKRKVPVPQKIVAAWESKNGRKYEGRVAVTP